MNIKYIALIVVIIVSATGLVSARLIYKEKKQEAVFCTMEAKLCPDGSYVGRTGPNCEFTQCPVLKSGITGIALLGPMCPVERTPPDPQCAPRPYKTELVAIDSNNSQNVKTFSSDEYGKFSVDLAPGEYTVSSAGTAGYFSHCSSQGLITVEKNEYTDITLNCDTGIR